MKLKGRWFISLYGKDGELKDYREGNNIVVDTGKSFVAEFLASSVASPASWPMYYIAIGTDNTAEAASQVALGTELDRRTGVASLATGAIYRVTATFPSGPTFAGSVYEYGLFNVPTAACGTMFSRDLEGVITKGVNDDLVVITEVTVS